MIKRESKKSLLLMFALFTTGLLLAGCGGESEEGPAGSETTIFTFDISSFSPQTASGNAVGDVTPTATVEANGSMLIVGPNGERYLFDFNPVFDESALTITTTLEVKLDPGLYTFYMLLNLNIQSVTHQYAGIAPVLIFKAVENKVHLNLNPTLTFLISVNDLRSLSRLTFDYPADIKTWTNPRFGISIDAVNNGSELFFNINKDTANGPVVILLPSRSEPYLVKCRFYDGSLVRVVCPGSEEEVVLPPADEAPVEIEPVPLTAEITYSFTSANGGETGNATFLFNIPKEIVDEVGGPETGTDLLSGRLLATVTLVGPENTLSEQNLTLTPQINPETNSISFYQASIMGSGFDPGTITWSLNFFDIRNNPSQLFAYCAQSVDVTSGADPNHGSFVCDLQLIDRSLTSQFPVGTVNVSVNDGSQVSGAVIIVDSEPVGITSSGTTENAEGTFSFFLGTGFHQVSAGHEAVDPYGSGKILTRTATGQPINLTANSVQQVSLSLPPLAEPPKVTGSSPNQGATDISVSSSVSITFSKPMAPLVTGPAFSISPDTAGERSWSGDFTVLTFTPDSDLAENTAYRVIVSTEAKEEADGIPLQRKFTLDFTTGSAPDKVAPSVSSTVPADLSGNVSVGTSITVTFSEAMNTASAQDALIVLPPPGGATKLLGFYTWSGDNSVMTFVPDQSLSYSQTYTATVAASATDTSGNRMAADFTFSFQTGVADDTTAPMVTSTLPAGGAVDVPLDATVTVVFSEVMDVSSTESAFQLDPEDVAGSINWSNPNALTFTPSAPLDYETVYTIIIGANATDTSGNSLGEPFSITFTTLKAPVASFLTVEAALTRRPRRRDDGYINLDSETRIKIPTQLQVEVVNDEDGNPLGNPERFLLFLHLGKVKCIYLGGKWERYLGWVREDRDERAFKSPSCNRGKQAGDIITVPQRHKEDEHDGEDGEDGEDDHHHSRLHGAKIKARVISGDPAFKETRIRVTIPVVTE